MGVYYQKLSDTHGVSKSTVRKRIVKLKKLRLTGRNF